MLNSYFNLPEGTSCYIHILDSSVGPIWSQEKLEDLPGPFQGIEFSQYAGVYSKKTHPITSNYHSWAILFWLAMPYITNYFSLKKRWAVGECRGPGRSHEFMMDFESQQKNTTYINGSKKKMCEFPTQPWFLGVLRNLGGRENLRIFEIRGVLVSPPFWTMDKAPIILKTKAMEPALFSLYFNE